jgi:hypothetical protein
MPVSVSSAMHLRRVFRGCSSLRAPLGVVDFDSAAGMPEQDGERGGQVVVAGFGHGVLLDAAFAPILLSVCGKRAPAPPGAVAALVLRSRP